jgi:hypothetical protein
MSLNHSYHHQPRAEHPTDVDLQFRMEFIFDKPGFDLPYKPQHTQRLVLY